MHVRVLPFGILKEWLGDGSVAVELREAATVADLLDHLAANTSASGAMLQGIAVGVNAEYATARRVLHEGDEVALAAAGFRRRCCARANVSDECRGSRPWSRSCASGSMRRSWLPRPSSGEDGAVVVFDGIVRNHSRGRRTLHLDYEAYEEMALEQMRELAEQARSRFAIRQVTMVHRLGRLEIGETSVLIVVASAHRGAAFEACRWLIDTLKQTRAHLEERDLCGWRGVGAWRAVSRGACVDPAESPHEG